MILRHVSYIIPKYPSPLCSLCQVHFPNLWVQVSKQWNYIQILHSGFAELSHRLGWGEQDREEEEERERERELLHYAQQEI